jgi:DNA polymerase
MLENYDYILSIDIETYSPEELTTCGVYKYATHPDARILWLACELYDLKTKTRHPVAKVDLLKYAFPEPIKAHLLNPRVAKFAWNANFERTFLAARLGITVGPEHWFCTMVLAARAGYPMSLDAAAKAKGVVNQKSGTGRALINYFCKPCAPTKVNNGRTRNLPDDAPVKWEEFGEYCAQDVRAESDIRDSLLVIPVSEFETKLWHLDQKINDRGVRVDVDFIINAIRIHKEYVDDLKIEAFNITGLDNPNSRDQLIQWLRDNEVEVETLRKADVASLIKQVQDGDVKRMLGIRSEVNKTSVKKYQAMLNCVGSDGRVRGTVQFYGANRTGRWCLAENTQILVKNEHGISEKNIQDVSISDMVFDGDTWVEHEGVVYSGEKEVINWDGICASEEHIVYLNDSTSLPLIEAKQQQLPLWKGNTVFTDLLAHQEGVTSA